VDRYDFFYRQKVTEAELDAALAAAERADWNLAADIGIFGIISGGVVVEADPVPNKTVDITGPMKAHDKTGRRVFLGAGINLDLSVDENGVPTDVTGGDGRERWVSVFASFDRSLSDPRTDGAGQQIQFQQNESIKWVVRQGAEADNGLAAKVPLDDNLILLADVRRHQDIGDPAPDPNVIGNEHIDTTRRQAFVVFNAGQISAETGAFLRIAGGDVQAALASADGLLDTAITRMDDHVGGAAEKHPAQDVTFDATNYSFIGQGGAGGVLPPTHVRQACELNEGMLGTHILDTDPVVRHAAASIVAVDPGLGIGNDLNVGVTVQAQLDSIRTRLAEQGAGEAGTWKIGSQDLIFGTYYSQGADTLAVQLSSLANKLNDTHITYARMVHSEAESTLGNGVSRTSSWLAGEADFATVTFTTDPSAGDLKLVTWGVDARDGSGETHVYVKNDSGQTQDYVVRFWKVG